MLLLLYYYLLLQFFAPQGNTSCIKSPDEYTVIVETNRGPKDFQYDQVFTPEHGQEKVFEDTNVSPVYIFSILVVQNGERFACSIQFYFKQVFVVVFIGVCSSFTAESYPVSCGRLQCLHFCLWSNWLRQNISF